MNTTKTPGQVSFEGYYSTESHMLWKNLGDNSKDDWENSAKSVLNMNKEKEPTIGEVAYNKYAKRMKIYYSKLWVNQNEDYKNIWEDVAMAVLNHSTPPEVKKVNPPGKVAYNAFVKGVTNPNMYPEWSQLTLAEQYQWASISAGFR